MSDQHPFNERSLAIGKYSKMHHICTCSNKLQKVCIEIVQCEPDDRNNIRSLLRTCDKNAQIEFEGFGFTIEDKFLATNDILGCICGKYYLECKLCGLITYAHHESHAWCHISLNNAYICHINIAHKGMPIKANTDQEQRFYYIEDEYAGEMRFIHMLSDPEFLENQLTAYTNELITDFYPVGARVRHVISDYFTRYLIDYTTFSCMICDSTFMCPPTEEIWFWHIKECCRKVGWFPAQ